MLPPPHHTEYPANVATLKRLPDHILKTIHFSPKSTVSSKFQVLTHTFISRQQIKQAIEKASVSSAYFKGHFTTDENCGIRSHREKLIAQRFMQVHSDSSKLFITILTLSVMELFNI